MGKNYMNLYCEGFNMDNGQEKSLNNKLGREN